MPTEKKEKCFCEKCRKLKSADDFYQTNNLEKYPNGKLKQCKPCMTMHVDNWDPKTYLWILQECDVPYIPEVWSKLLKSYAKDPTRVTGMTIIGRYLGQMRLQQWRDYHWKDSDYLQKVALNKLESTMKASGYDAVEIAEAIAAQQQDLKVEPPPADIVPPDDDDAEFTYKQPWANQVNDDDPFSASLTEEDKLMLLMKWGKSYKPSEWVQLEKLYNEMLESYDIQTAGHFDTLKLVCKTSLKANQLLDLGDVDGAQKMIKMYDSLMKSGKFTAAQNKGENGDYIDSVSELVAMCEKDGFIPRYYVDGPQDKVDRTIQDLQGYTRTLIMEEQNLGEMIEAAVRQIQQTKENEAILDADAAGDDEAFENQLFDENQAFLNDDDFAELRDQINDEAEDDEDFINSLVDEEDLI